MQNPLYDLICEQYDETIVDWRSCQWTGEQFPIFENDVTLLEKLSPVVNGKKYQLPLPDYAPYERMLQRLASRNNRFLYKRKCDLTGETIISTYSKNKPYKVYGVDAWHSDKRNVFEYGREFDFSRWFFEQFQELKVVVPRLAVYVDHTSVNCTYANGAVSAKNLYLCDTCAYSEDAWYSSWILHGEYCMDCYKVEKIRNCYRAIQCKESESLQYCLSCDNSNTCYYSVQLMNCHHCFWCSNLVNASYCLFNKQVTKDEWQDFVDQHNFWSYEQRQTRYDQWVHETLPQTIFPNMDQVTTSESLGNRMVWCDKCFRCFDQLQGQEIRYCSDSIPVFATCMDTSYSNGEKGYMNFSVLWNNLYGNTFTWVSNDCYYCDSCQYSNHLFGCVGLNNASYCIFNKQYTKEEYFEKIQQIIEKMIDDDEWWKFFPPALATFAYNETVAHEYEPLSKEEAFRRWYQRQEEIPPVDLPENAEVIKTSELPDDIAEVDESISSKILLDEQTQKPFRIIWSELAFYKKMKLPLPRHHYDQRYAAKRLLTPGRKFHIRNCDKSWKKMISIYKQDDPFTVYDLKRFQKEMYW